MQPSGRHRAHEAQLASGNLNCELEFVRQIRPFSADAGHGKEVQRPPTRSARTFPQPTGSTSAGNSIHSNIYCRSIAAAGRRRWVQGPRRTQNKQSDQPFRTHHACERKRSEASRLQIQVSRFCVFISKERVPRECKVFEGTYLHWLGPLNSHNDSTARLLISHVLP